MVRAFSLLFCGPPLTVTVNELSNTIDLQSTLLRAQALFRRFQRTVEAIDKKHNFPTPTVRQRKPDTDTTNARNTSSVASGTDSRPPGLSSTTKPDSPIEVVRKERIISPELRNLLSRKVEKLGKEDVANHGGGIG